MNKYGDSGPPCYYTSNLIKTTRKIAIVTDMDALSNGNLPFIFLYTAQKNKNFCRSLIVEVISLVGPSYTHF